MKTTKVFALIAFISLIAFANYCNAAKEENLVLYFDFEGKGDTAIDRSGNGNDGTITGAQRVNDKFGKGLSFDGEDDDLSFPLNGLSAKEGTILFWVKQLRADETGMIFNHHDPNRIYIKAKKSEGVRVTLGVSRQSITNKILKVGDWYHVALAWHEGKCELYLDGELIQEGTYEGLNAINPVSHLCNHRGSQMFNKAVVDEFKVFSVALDNASIQQELKGAAVFVSGKCSTTWATIKSTR